jgi:hypothetical protein
MLDKRTEMMLQVASTLTAEDLDCLRGAVSDVMAPSCDDADEQMEAEQGPSVVADGPDDTDGHDANSASPVDPAGPAPTTRVAGRTRSRISQASTARGEYERQRTRESKISTSCVGHEREKHDWWPVGTELVGRIGSETFTAMVVENTQVKSGRSLLITSGPANGKVCLTPTRAAIEVTEHYRQANNLGRGGGVTNGWDFWQPRT